MGVMAGAANVGDFASAIGVRAEEAAVIAELKAGSEDAYTWLVGEFHQPVYGIIYRILTDPADAADTTQDVFLKVFRGMKHFHGGSSLKTWIYRIAIHEASNRRRWWFRRGYTRTWGIGRRLGADSRPGASVAGASASTTRPSPNLAGESRRLRRSPISSGFRPRSSRRFRTCS